MSTYLRFTLIGLLFVLVNSLGAQIDFASTLPLIIVDTEGQEIPDEPKVLARMGVIDNGPGQLNHPTDAFNDYEGYVGIELRGSSTQGYPKQGYGLETRNADGSDRQVPLLGFPVEEDWVLRGPYSDKSLVRDALAYHLAGRMMAYAPRVRLVELILNGDYRGVYLFTESIKRDRNRVDIKKMQPRFAAGDSLTGGYILKLDKFTAEDFTVPFLFESAYRANSTTDQRIRFLYHYPKPADITAAQRDYIGSWVANFEDALAGDDFLDPVSGYRPYVDLQSFVDFLLVNELTRNVDGYRLSSYFYKERDSKGGRLHMGPVWDFNFGFGNADYCRGGDLTGWALDYGQVCPDDFFLLPFWWDRLQQDPAFRLLLRQRWNALRADFLATDRLHGTIDSLVNSMGDATTRNFARWPVLGEYVWPNNFVGSTYFSEVSYLKNWLRSRAAWLDGAIDRLTPVSSPTVSGKLGIRPNPTNGKFELLTTGNEELFDVTVYDDLGRRVYAVSGRLGANSIDLSDLPTGIYLLRARRADDTVVTGRVVRS